MTDNSILVAMIIGVLFVLWVLFTRYMMEGRANLDKRRPDPWKPPSSSPTAARPAPPAASKPQPVRPLTLIGFSFRAWTTAKMLTAEAERIRDRFRARDMEPQTMGCMEMIRDAWLHHSIEPGEPLDVSMQAFMLMPHMLAVMNVADKGLLPLRPSEVWLMLYAVVLLTKTHDKQQLAQAIQRLEERAAERNRL